jgi:hypothetical protein
MSVGALPAHDAAIVGDTLTTISLNQEWRAIIAGALEEYWQTRETDATTLDNLDFLSAFMLDLYD